MTMCLTILLLSTCYLITGIVMNARFCIYGSLYNFSFHSGAVGSIDIVKKSYWLAQMLKRTTCLVELWMRRHMHALSVAGSSIIMPVFRSSAHQYGRCWIWKGKGNIWIRNLTRNLITMQEPWRWIPYQDSLHTGATIDMVHSLQWFLQLTSFNFHLSEQRKEYCMNFWLSDMEQLADRPACMSCGILCPWAS